MNVVQMGFRGPVVQPNGIRPDCQPGTPKAEPFRSGSSTSRNQMNMSIRRVRLAIPNACFSHLACVAWETPSCRSGGFDS